MADYRTDYYRAANAIDLVEWLAGQTEDQVTLAKYVQRLRTALEYVEARLADPQGNT